MLGYKPKIFKFHSAICLEDMVPQDNFYRQVEAKQWHEGRRFRLRGLEKVNIEGILKAAGQNIKRLLKGKTWRKPLKPAGSAALRPAFGGLFAGRDFFVLFI
jgi:DDE family transposase